jgi:hypothetical protein
LDKEVELMGRSARAPEVVDPPMKSTPRQALKKNV